VLTTYTEVNADNNHPRELLIVPDKEADNVAEALKLDEALKVIDFLAIPVKSPSETKVIFPLTMYVKSPSIK